MKDIILLGSTGSVGKSVLDVVRQYPEHFRIKALASNENISLLINQMQEFMPEEVVIGAEKHYAELSAAALEGTRVSAGDEEIVALAASDVADMVFMAIAGRTSLNPLVAALEKGKTIALASKEPIVSAGNVIKKLLYQHNAKILPVDSEHSAIMQCLGTRTNKDVRQLYITGSGGSLLNRRKEDFDSLTVDEVLDHPKWQMGRKITVDSATLMNKGLEVIEAHWLFDVPLDKIKVIIHPEAIVHSMVEFSDGTIRASLFCPDMKFPILKALSHPDIFESDFPRVDFNVIKNLNFFDPDLKKFPALKLAFNALADGGTAPAVLNSANEAAVNKFLSREIKFTEIVRIVEKVLSKHKKIDDPSLDEIIMAEEWAHEEVLKVC